MAVFDLVIGCGLAFSAAAALALSMVTQRYAPGLHTDEVPLCGTVFGRNTVWFMGLVGYGVANGLYAVSLMFGPLAVLASVFTTLLVFNMLFARLFLGEELTPEKEPPPAPVSVPIVA